MLNLGRSEIDEISQGRRIDIVLRETLDGHYWRNGGVLILDEIWDDVRGDELPKIYQALEIWGKEHRVVILNTDHRISTQMSRSKYIFQR